ncbi:hypothetical protein T09_9131 [Trichinella sp. T9]|nr:hypothetical protein T09_9131 [Trichinella sp. T9]
MASSGMLQINRYKYEKNPIDNVLISNEERMTSLIAGKAITFLCREEMENGCIVTTVFRLL